MYTALKTDNLMTDYADEPHMPFSISPMHREVDTDLTDAIPHSSPNTPMHEES